MDPTATLQSLLEAVQERDPEMIVTHARDLAEWIEKDGYTPLSIMDILSAANQA